MRTAIFKKSAGVLVEFDSAEDDEIALSDSGPEARRGSAVYVAGYFWNERLFGMKIKRLGPTILASEIIIPIPTAAAFIDTRKNWAHRFGVEICIDCLHHRIEERALIMATSCATPGKEVLHQSAPGRPAYQCRGEERGGALRTGPLECRFMNYLHTAKNSAS